VLDIEAARLRGPLLGIVTISLAILVSGCVSLSSLSLGAAGDHIHVATGPELPPPVSVDPASADRPYRVGPLDTLKIDVPGVEELSQKALQVDAAGHLGVPLIGTIDAAGVSLDELSATIEERLRERFVRRPQVTLSLQETTSQVMTLDGDLNQPGLYPVVGRMTLTKAIATARGAKKPSRLKRVVVFRDIGGQKMAGIYNLLAIYRGNYADPEVFAGDTVIVGNAEARTIFKGLPDASSSGKAPVIVSFEAQ
jgi:polysaccharide export outer membrane protein